MITQVTHWQIFFQPRKWFYWNILKTLHDTLFPRLSSEKKSSDHDFLSFHSTMYTRILLEIFLFIFILTLYKSQKFDNFYLITKKIINLLQIPCLLQCSNLLLLETIYNVVKCGSCINFQTIWIKYWSWLRERWRDPSQHPAENYLVISARKHGSSISELWTKTSFIIKQFLLEYGMDAENINFKGNLCILISKIFLPHLFVSK